MKFIPNGNKIVVKELQLATDEITESGIIIPDSAVSNIKLGEVMAVGSGDKIGTTGEIRKSDLNTGDIVMYSPVQNAERQIEGKKYLLIHSTHIDGHYSKADWNKLQKGKK